MPGQLPDFLRPSFLEAVTRKRETRQRRTKFEASKDDSPTLHRCEACGITEASIPMPIFAWPRMEKNTARSICLTWRSKADGQSSLADPRGVSAHLTKNFAHVEFRASFEVRNIVRQEFRLSLDGGRCNETIRGSSPRPRPVSLKRCAASSAICVSTRQSGLPKAAPSALDLPAGEAPGAYSCHAITLVSMANQNMRVWASPLRSTGHPAQGKRRQPAGQSLRWQRLEMLP